MSHGSNNKDEEPLKDDEKPLTGGRVTKGVIRVGNTVRRPLGKNLNENGQEKITDKINFVHQLLKHFEKVGFQGAPRFLGIDESNREILSYIEGHVPPDLDYWSDQQLIAAAKLIRQYHDATTSFTLKGTEEVVCHNDLSPCNAVMRDGIPIAFIDFDAASPGTRIHDLAYAVWLWCDLGNDEIDPKLQAHRIKLMCDAYGLENREHFISEIQKVQMENIQKYKGNIKNGLPHWEGAVQWGESCLQWVIKNRKVLENEL